MVRTALSANCLSAVRSVAPIVLLGFVQNSVLAAQEPHGRGPRHDRGSHIQMLQVPFPFIDRTVKFHARQLAKYSFIQMGANYAALPKGFDGKLQLPQNSVQLNYGYKKGGIVRVYETPRVSGTSAKQFLHDLVEARVFRDINGTPDFKLTEVPDKSLFIAISYTDPKLFDLAKSQIQ